MTSSADALQRLREGNDRFVKGESTVDSNTSHSQRPDMSGGQSPFAIVLACSDSRVPTEQIFDQSFGDLFVIRVAGNIATSTQVGSIEYAATQLGTRLVVVLGHSNCGAVAAALGELAGDLDLRSPNLRAILAEVHPALSAMSDKHSDLSTPDALDDAVRANVMRSAERLRHESSILEELIDSEELKVVGASYCIETGVVDYIDDGGL